MKQRRRFAEQSKLLLAPLDLLCLGLVKLLVLSLNLLPNRAAFVLARSFVSLFLTVMPRAHKVGLRNLELVFPEKSDAERADILKRSYDVLAGNLLGFARFPSLTKAKAAQSIDYRAGCAIMQGIRSRGGTTGVLIPTLHFGPFELLVQFHTLLERPSSFLARSFDLPMLDRWWNARREMFGSKFFTRKGGYAEIVRRLREGDDVVVLYDQNVKQKHAVFVDFFGIPAATTKAIAVAALRTKCPIVFATSVDRRNGTYELIAEEIPNPGARDSDGDVENDDKMIVITRALHDAAERAIRKHPEQWFWIHRRFKTRPKGEPETLYSGI